MRAGQLDVATSAAGRVGSTPVRRTHLSSLTVTFALVASAGLALAEGLPRRAATALGAADGLRRRAGLRTWPLARQTEAELTEQVRNATDPETFHEAFAAGAELNARDAVALVAASATAPDETNEQRQR